MSPSSEKWENRRTLTATQVQSRTSVEAIGIAGGIFFLRTSGFSGLFRYNVYLPEVLGAHPCVFPATRHWFAGCWTGGSSSSFPLAPSWRPASCR